MEIMLSNVGPVISDTWSWPDTGARPMMHMNAHTPNVCRKRADMQKFQKENTSPDAVLYL